MDLLIILTYTAICICVFKVFNLPLNKWTVPTAVLGGVAILSAIMLLMNYNHPYAKYAKDYFITIPIVPQVSGTVATVDVEPNVKVKQGTILFTLENSQQRIALKQAEAALADEQNNVLQKDESLLAANAKVKKAESERNRSKASYDRVKEANDSAGENSPFSQQEIENKYNFYLSAEATLDAAKSEQRRIKLITESKIQGENTKVAQLLAAKEKAQLDYDRTFIKAPVDGMASHIAIRPGTRATALPLAPVMTFIPTEKRRIAGLFFQNSVKRLEVGSSAEVIFDALPGQVFTGKLVSVMPAMSEGQVQAVGSLMSANNIMRHGFVIGVIELDEDLNEHNLPLGVQGQAVVINAEHDILHVSLVRRILLRMMAWLKYVYPIK
ncbi:HlyD family secretion protein [Thalassomonas sp. M1454]|uniref:HlyD family secretion protein n=1 Tax=Thalassomonas sp. M1454 TaxID=2594477 RepID=UPI0011803780|nr:HlyD family secretion protein [Thalassomonas sp. M1454]TRX56795.1 HlyD family secretion protein [Thalassomonas sp. M1454]